MFHNGWQPIEDRIGLGSTQDMMPDVQEGFKHFPPIEPPVKQAYKMHLQGLGVKSIADKLTKQGFRSRRGAAMNTATIGEWFRNPHVHAGCVVWNTRDKKLKPKPREKWIIVEDAYPAIISMEVADKTYQKAESRRLGKTPRKQENYLLSGLMRCSECNARMIVSSHRKKNVAYYRCGTRQRSKYGCANRLMLHQRAVEGQIIEWIKQTLLDTDFLNDYFQRVLNTSKTLLKESQLNVEKLERKILSLDHQVDRLIDAVADGAIPSSSAKLKIDTALAEKRETESQIRRYARPLPKLPDIATFQHEFLQALDTPEMQKAAVSGLIQEIVVHPTAALEIQCSSNWVSDYSATAYRPETKFEPMIYQFVPPPRGGYRKPLLSAIIFLI